MIMTLSTIQERLKHTDSQSLRRLTFLKYLLHDEGHRIQFAMFDNAKSVKKLKRQLSTCSCQQGCKSCHAIGRNVNDFEKAKLKLREEEEALSDTHHSR